VDVDAQQSAWVEAGRVRLIAPAAARTAGDDPRDRLDATAAIVDLRRGDDGLWRGAAGVDFVVPGQAADGAWVLAGAGDGRLTLRVGERTDAAARGCWSSGSRTIADVIVIRGDGERWTASMCGTRYPVVECAGRREAARRWEAAVLRTLTAGVDVDPDTCTLRSTACDLDRLVARCGEAWVLPDGPIRRVVGPDVAAAGCGRGFLEDTGVEVPDPCVAPAEATCRPPALPSEGLPDAPDPAAPYVRWCGEAPTWTGPGLHPPYRPGRPHGAVLACWRRALERDPDACGEVRAVVARPFAVGGTTQVGGLTTTLDDDDLAGCLARALQEWEPPGPADGGAIPIRAILRAPGPAVPRTTD